jgi:hypothetical protein
VYDSKENLVIARWRRKYQVPNRTYRDWMAIYHDPKRGFFNGKGRPSTFDPQAKIDFMAKCRTLAFPTDHNNVIMADVQNEGATEDHQKEQ